MEHEQPVPDWDLKVGDPDDRSTLYRDGVSGEPVPGTSLCGEWSGIDRFCTRWPHQAGNHAFGDGTKIVKVWPR